MGRESGTKGDKGPWLDLNNGHRRIMTRLSDVGTPGRRYFYTQMVQDTLFGSSLRAVKFLNPNAKG